MMMMLVLLSIDHHVTKWRGFQTSSEHSLNPYTDTVLPKLTPIFFPQVDQIFPRADSSCAVAVAAAVSRLVKLVLVDSSSRL
jgi:hypothetical protein